MAWNCNCGREWTGLAQAHCASGCHEHFSTVANFDAHRRDGHCNDPGTILDGKGRPVLKPVRNRFGVTWVGAAERPSDLNEGAA